MPQNLPGGELYDANDNWLPFLSDFPIVNSGTLPDAVFTALKFVKAKTGELLASLESPIISSKFVITKKILDLRDSVTSARRFIPDEAKKYPISLHPVSNAHLLDEFGIYDNYFGVKRADSIPFMLFVDQYFNITSQALEDVADSTIALETTIGLVKGLGQMASYLLATCEPFTQLMFNEIPYQSEPLKVHEDISRLPVYRWKLHHRVFALSLIFSIKALNQSIEAINNEQYDKAEGFILSASVFFRGSTVSMIAASAFSSATYNEIVRPTMISIDTPGGFSGNQNRDFENWRAAKNSFRELLVNKKEVIPILDKSLTVFYDTYITDMEEHIIIARNMKVGGSIGEEWYEKKYNLKLSRRAVDMLLQLLDERKKEFEFLLSPKTNTNEK